MDHFVRSLLSLPALSADQERSLALRTRAGDVDARADLIMSGMRSVALRGRMLGLQGEELRDAVQSGAVGLILAVDRFDPDRGARLATFAWWWIGAEMFPSRLLEEPLDDTDPGADDVLPFDIDLLDCLGTEGAQVLRLRFGLGSEAAGHMTRQAVADRLGLTISKVRTVEGKAMRQLRR